MHGKVVKVGTKSVVDDEFVPQRLGAPWKPLLLVRNKTASHYKKIVISNPANFQIDELPSETGVRAEALPITASFRESAQW